MDEETTSSTSQQFATASEPGGPARPARKARKPNAVTFVRKVGSGNVDDETAKKIWSNSRDIFYANALNNALLFYRGGDKLLTDKEAFEAITQASADAGCNALGLEIDAAPFVRCLSFTFDC